MFTFNHFLVCFNSIRKINAIPETNLICQLFFYTLWYSIVRIDLINTVKLWCQITKTTTIWCTLKIFKHCDINAKPHFIYVFGIADWKYKYFKCIFILCFIMPLKYFLIEIRFTCATHFFNPIKITIKQTLWLCRLVLECIYW